VLFLVGFCAAWFYIRSVPVADEFDGVVLFDMWALLLGALMGFALASCLYFVVWCWAIMCMFGRSQLRQLVPLVVSWLGTALLIQAMVGLLLILVFWGGAGGDSGGVDEELAASTRPLTLLAGLSQVPGLVGFLALRSLAVDETRAESPLCRLRLLVRLRSELQRLLATFGAFLTLLVIATGLRRKALLAMDPDVQVPPEGVLLYGLLFAVMLGLFYGAANGAIARRAELLLEEFAPLPDPADPELSDRVTRRRDLASLAAGGGSWSTFQTTVVIAAPLLSGLIGSATGK
jgi:hypothetical protein